MQRRVPILFGALGTVVLGLFLYQPWADVRSAEAFSGAVWKCVGFDAGDDVRATVWVHNDGADDFIATKVRFLDSLGATVSTTTQGPGLDQTVGFSAIGPSGQTATKNIQAAKITADKKTIIVDAERVMLGDDPSGPHRRQVACAKSDAAPDAFGGRGDAGR